MSAAIDNRASVLRDDVHRLGLSVDPAALFRYSLCAARWEELRLIIHDGNGTPEDVRKFRDLTPVLRALTADIGLEAATEDDAGPEAVPGITGWDGFLAPDHAYLIAGETWQATAAAWREYRP